MVENALFQISHFIEEDLQVRCIYGPALVEIPVWSTVRNNSVELIDYTLAHLVMAAHACKPQKGTQVRSREYGPLED